MCLVLCNLQGKNGKLFEKGSAAKRQTKKKDGVRDISESGSWYYNLSELTNVCCAKLQKLTKEKGKTSKDRRKATEAAAATGTNCPITLCFCVF